MNNLIQSIIFAVFGIVIILVGIFTSSDLAVLVIGILFTLVAIIFIVVDLLEKKKIKKELEHSRKFLKEVINNKEE